MRRRLLPTRPREGADNGADSVARGRLLANCDFNSAAVHLLGFSSFPIPPVLLAP
jgi:hypothetical protein